MLNRRIQYSGPDWYLFRHKLHLIHTVYECHYITKRRGGMNIRNISNEHRTKTENLKLNEENSHTGK